MLRVRVWRELPLESLQEECRALQLEEGGSRTALVSRLLQSAFGGPAHVDHLRQQCDARSIPWQRFSGETAVIEEVLRQVQGLEASSAADLKRQYRERGLPLEPGIEKQDLGVSRGGAAPGKFLRVWIGDRDMDRKQKGVGVMSAHHMTPKSGSAA